MGSGERSSGWSVIQRLMVSEFGSIRAGRRFGFDWIQYKSLEVYKLKILGDETIVGLTCLIDHPVGAEDAIEIECLELSKENIGLNKQYDGIAGTLIAFACRESFKRGHEVRTTHRPRGSWSWMGGVPET